MTERIWSKTNSSFGSNKPKSVNSVVMAQLILSNQLHITIREKYEELQKRYKNEQISEGETNEILITLKESRNQSQQISTENAEQIVEFLDDNIDDEIRKQKEKHIRLQKAEEKLAGLELEKNQKYNESKVEELEKTREEKEYQDQKHHIQDL